MLQHGVIELRQGEAAAALVDFSGKGRRLATDSLTTARHLARRYEVNEVSRFPIFGAENQRTLCNTFSLVTDMRVALNSYFISNSVLRLSHILVGTIIISFAKHFPHPL